MKELSEEEKERIEKEAKNQFHPFSETKHDAWIKDATFFCLKKNEEIELAKNTIAAINYKLQVSEERIVELQAKYDSAFEIIYALQDGFTIIGQLEAKVPAHIEAKIKILADKMMELSTKHNLLTKQ